MNVAKISVLYEEFEPETYRGVEFKLGDERAVFNTSNPTVDYLTVLGVLWLEHGQQTPVITKSSVDHFVMDGGVLDESTPSPSDVDAAIANSLVYLRALPKAPAPHDRPQGSQT